MPPGPATDAVPDLTDTQVAFRHESSFNLLRRFVTFQAMSMPALNRLAQEFAIRNAGNALGRFLLGWSFDLFLGGEDLRGCRKVMDHLTRYRARPILDFLAEGADTPAGRDRTAKEIARTIEFCARNGVDFAACKPSGLMDVEVLRRKQAGMELTPEETRTFEAGKARLGELARRAAEREVKLFVDAEWCFMQDEVDAMVEDLMREHNTRRPVVYHTLQMYRRDRLGYLDRLVERSEREGFIIALKLVRGAYMEFERAENPIDPIHPTLEETHRAYDRAIDVCLENTARVAMVVATHNRRSIEHTFAGMRRCGIPNDTEHVEVAQLFGMSDHLTYNAASVGARAHKYLPFGPLEESLPYLVRRAQENTAIGKDTTRELAVIRHELRRRLLG